MAAITDPRAITFVDDKVLPANDLFASAYLTAKTLISLWNSQGMGALIPFTSDVIANHAAPNGANSAGGDGRPIVLASAAEQVYNLAATLVSVYERGTVDGSGSVNNATVNNVLGINVNGRSIF